MQRSSLNDLDLALIADRITDSLPADLLAALVAIEKMRSYAWKGVEAAVNEQGVGLTTDERAIAMSAIEFRVWEEGRR